MSVTLIYLLIAVVSLLVGIAAGAFITRRQQNAPSDSNSLQQQLQTLKTQARQNFSETAVLLTELEKNQQRLRDHLAASSKQLADLDFDAALEQAPSAAQPPLDYATERGALSEGYRLNDEREKPASTALPPLATGHAYDIPHDEK